MKTKAYFLILLLAVFFGRAAAQNNAAENLKPDFTSWSSAAAEGDSAPRPPLNAVRITGEILSGTACGIALIVAVDILTKNTNQWGLSQAQAYGAAIGFIIGTPLGVWIVGSMGPDIRYALSLSTGSHVPVLGPGQYRPIKAIVLFLNLTRPAGSAI